MIRAQMHRPGLIAVAALVAVGLVPIAEAGHFGGRNQVTPGMKRSFDPDQRASIRLPWAPRTDRTAAVEATRPDTRRVLVADRARDRAVKASFSLNRRPGRGS